MLVYRIPVAIQFSKRPMGRHLKDGRFSGEAFREQILLPAFKSLISESNGQPFSLIVDFTDVTMTGSSFLEEAFGGLIRNHDIDSGLLKKSLTIYSPRRSSLSATIFEYIDNAIEEKKTLLRLAS